MLVTQEHAIVVDMILQARRVEIENNYSHRDKNVHKALNKRILYYHIPFFIVSKEYRDEDKRYRLSLQVYCALGTFFHFLFMN